MDERIEKTVSKQKPPVIMGIVNLTEDSFYDGGKFLHPRNAVNQAKKLLENGADIIDIGAESSRPGAAPISEETEYQRIESFFNQWPKNLKTRISVDTGRASVARLAISHGAEIINDIYALRRDPGLTGVIKDAGCKIVLMHMQGTPPTMQKAPRYQNIIQDIILFFKERIDYALKNGIKKENIILDPGIGFGKSVQDNLCLLKNLNTFKELGFPVLVGPSRKSFISKTLKKETTENIFGTAGVIAWLTIVNTDIIRLHDVEEMNDVIRILRAIETAGENIS